MKLKSNLSFNKSNISKYCSKNKSAEKNIFHLKRNIDRQKDGIYILNSKNITDKNNLETNENSSDISFYNTSLKNQILSPEEEDDIYQYNRKNKEIMEKNNDDIDCNYRGLRNINNLNLVSENSNNFKKGKKILILDLDETLVHSSFQAMKINNKLIKPDIYFKIFFNYKYQEIFVYIRPFLNQFLKEMHKLFNIYVFTASIKKYAKPLLNLLDMNNYIIKKFYRESCTLSNGKFIKDLKSLNLKLNDVIILDNNPISYKYNKRNGLPIKSWHYDKNDKELIKIIPLLNFLSTVDDVRKYISFIIENDEINFNKVNMLIRPSSSNKKGKFFNFNKLIRHNSNNIRLNKKINYNIDEEVKVNNINNNYNGTINFREPLKNKIVRSNNDYNPSFNNLQNNESNKKIKKRKKIKNNSISIVNFNLNKNEIIEPNINENNSNLNINKKLSDIYYKSCNNFYINNKYSFVINREKEKKPSIKNKIKNLYLNNDENEESNIINKYKSHSYKSRRIPSSKKNENKICLNKKLSSTEKGQNLVINKKSKFKNYLNRFNSYKNITPYKNINSIENDYYTITPLVKNKDENNYLRKNNTIEALGNHKSNSIRNIICYNSSNFTNTLNNNISNKNTLNYDRILFNKKENKKCINTKYVTNYKYYKKNQNTNNTNKKILSLLNNEENNIINKNNIHKLLTDRNNIYYNLNDNNLFNNYSLKKEKVNIDTNCFIKRKMKLKKSLLNDKNIIGENAKSSLNEDNSYHFQFLNNFPSSERNHLYYK